MTDEDIEIFLKHKNLDEKLELISRIEASGNLMDNDIKTIQHLAEDENNEVRARIAEVLVLVDSSIAEEILIKLLRDYDEIVRINACDSLSISKSAEVINLLKERALKDKSSLVRGYAISSIADIVMNLSNNPQELILFFQQVLNKEKIDRVKINLYYAMYKLGKKSYLEEILNQLNNRLYTNRCLVLNILNELLSEESSIIIKPAIMERLQVEKTLAVQSSIEKLLNRLEATIARA